MKQVYFILLLCCFSLFAYSTTNSIDSISDFLSEKDCWRIDSLFALSSLVTIDSILDNSAQEQPSRSSLDYSYQTTFFIAQTELNICGTSPYIELVDGYVLVDWRWNYFHQITLVSQKEWYSQRVTDLVQHHIFSTNILWSELNNLSPIYWANKQCTHVDVSVNMVPIRSLDQLRGINSNPPYPDKDFSGDYSIRLYWDGLSAPLAHRYYQDHSPKYEAYLAFCDSMQNIYKNCLIEHIKKRELSNVSIQ